jgi:hypothetical protein
MGGMFTILKVREGIKDYRDPGWYDVPAGTQATIAAEDALRRDGIDPKHAPSVEDDPTSKPHPA